MCIRDRFHISGEVCLRFINVPLVFEEVPLGFLNLSILVPEFGLLQLLGLELSRGCVRGRGRVAGLDVELDLDRGVCLPEVRALPPAAIYAESTDSSWALDDRHCWACVVFTKLV